MSRGPGIWQREILNRLQSEDAFYLADLLSADSSRSELVAAGRAAKSLAGRGAVQYAKVWGLIETQAGQRENPVSVIARREVDLRALGFRPVATEPPRPVF